jgi:hypothetical protein
MAKRKSESDNGKRDQLITKMVSDLFDSWIIHGAAALEEVRQKNPQKYCELAAALIPKQVLGTEQAGPLDHCTTTEELRQALLEEGLTPKQIDILIEGAARH